MPLFHHHCPRGVPRRAHGASRWRALLDFISIPPSPKNHKDQWAWFGGRLQQQKLNYIQNHFSDGKGFIQGTFLLSLTFYSSEMSSLYLRRLLALSGNRPETQPLYSLPDIIRHGRIPDTLETCYMSTSRRGNPWSVFECQWLPMSHDPPFLSICHAFQQHQ